MRKKIFIVLTILWMCMIFYMSNQPANISSAQSGGVIDLLSTVPVIDGVVKSMISNGTAEFVIRKGAHMFLYAILSVLCFMSMYDVNTNFKKICIKSLLISFLYACTDEFHQLFIQGRSGEFRDILVDFTGAIIGTTIIIYIIIKKIIKEQT